MEVEQLKYHSFPHFLVFESPFLLSVSKPVPTEVGWHCLFRDIGLAAFFKVYWASLGSSWPMPTLLLNSNLSRKSVSPSMSGCGVLHTKGPRAACPALADWQISFPYGTEVRHLSPVWPFSFRWWPFSFHWSSGVTLGSPLPQRRQELPCCLEAAGRVPMQRQWKPSPRALSGAASIVTHRFAWLNLLVAQLPLLSP